MHRTESGAEFGAPSRFAAVLESELYRLLGLNTNTTSSTVCAGPGAYFHFITACEAYCNSMGFPPLGSTFDTFPFGSTVASRRTWPSKWPFFRIVGYSGSNIVRTLRWVFT